MAQATVRIPVTKWAYVDDRTPVGVIDITGQTSVNLRYWYGSAPSWNGSILYMGTDGFPKALDKQRIYYFKGVFCFQGHNGQAGLTSSRAMTLYAEDFDPATLEYSTKPALYGGCTLRTDSVGTTGRDTDVEMVPNTYGSAEALSRAATLSLRFPSIALVNSYAQQYNLSTVYVKLWTLADGETAPYLEVTYDDSIAIGSQIVVANAPTSGYVNPRESSSFSWAYEKDTSSGYDCVGEEYGQSSAVFYWKTSEDNDYTAIPINDGTQNITVPANTFPVNATIEWYVEGTDDGGTTSETEVFSFSTSAGAVTATPTEPANSVETNNQEITFTWSYISADGFAPSRYILQWRETGESNWTTLEDSQTVTTSYIAAANTFPAGEIQWRVVPYNIDGVIGTGAIAAFVSFGAPEAPQVTATNVPFSTITWQSDDQQAYEITVDDTVYGPYFGTEKTYEIPDYLEDGTHVIKVRVMGTYALWGQVGQAIVTIQNEPGEDISLTGTSNIDADLTINTEAEDPDFLIYRDGALIGRTNNKTFTDRFVLGAHNYYAINKLSTGNYTKSNEFTIETVIDTPQIALISGGEWVPIQFWLEGDSDPSYKESTQTAYNHLAGDTFPSVVISEYQDSDVSFSAVFLYTQAAIHERFRAMFGKPVILKLKDGAVITGVLDSWSKQVRKQYWTSYSFTIKRVEWEEYVDDTQ